MELTLEQAATLAFMRELGEKEGPDSAAQKEYDEMVALLVVMAIFGFFSPDNPTVGECREIMMPSEMRSFTIELQTLEVRLYDLDRRLDKIQEVLPK
jgi:hypothetical protein